MSDEVVPGMAEEVEARRLALGLSPGDFARLAGLTDQGLQPVRSGFRRNYQTKTRVGFARALQLPVDALERLMAGEKMDTIAVGTPTPRPGPISPDEIQARLDRTDALIAELQATVERLLRERGHEQ